MINFSATTLSLIIGTSLLCRRRRAPWGRPAEPYPGRRVSSTATAPTADPPLSAQADAEAAAR